MNLTFRMLQNTSSEETVTYTTQKNRGCYGNTKKVLILAAV